jgi:hypothetical protein
MILSSSSSRKKRSYTKKSSKTWLSNNSSKKYKKYHEKQQLYISQFKLNNLNKSKNHNEKKNQIINKNKNNDNDAMNDFPFNCEAHLNNVEQNSTFVFTGDNASYVDYSQIIGNYLKKPNISNFFDCKSISTISIQEKTNLLIQKDNSFSLSSSKTSKTKSTKANNKNNKKLMQLLKQINTADNIIGNNNIKKNEKKVEKKYFDKKPLNIAEKRKEKKNIVKDMKTKIDIKKKAMFAFFLFVNIIVYAFIIVNLFEPSASSLFYDNDHNNYIYRTSLLSQDRSIVMNK